MIRGLALFGGDEVVSWELCHVYGSFMPGHLAHLAELVNPKCYCKNKFQWHVQVLKAQTDLKNTAEGTGRERTERTSFYLLHARFDDLLCLR